MKRSLCVVSAVALLWASCAAGVRVRLPTGLEKQKGMSYATWSAGAYSLPDSDVSLENLAETGADWIALIVTCYQADLASLRIAANETTPTDAGLIHVIRQAHDLGLRVMLKPHLDLSRDIWHWRGEIGREYTTEAQWAEWFTSYRTFIEHYAALAEDHGADQFCVGTELEGTTHREDDWRNVVAVVRARFDGPIIYAANHDGEEVRLTWWDAVDFIGVDAYYPLTARTNPTLAELMAAWQPKTAALAALAARWQKPVILTEIGYRSIDGAAIHPWDYQITGRIDLQEQSDCYRAAFESVFGQPWFAGIYWWAWSPDPRRGGPTDDDYTPHGKPAEAVIRNWYGGRADGPGEDRDRRQPPRPSVKDKSGHSRKKAGRAPIFPRPHPQFPRFGRKSPCQTSINGLVRFSVPSLITRRISPGIKGWHVSWISCFGRWRHNEKTHSKWFLVSDFGGGGSGRSYARHLGQQKSQVREMNSMMMPMTKSVVDLRMDMRKLWEDHITYTRNYIMSALAKLPDTGAVADRLLRNQDDIGNAVKPVYGEAAGQKLASLLRDHILVATEVVKAAMDGKADALGQAQAKWTANADQIAAFLSGANPNWPEAALKDMLHKHLEYTTQEVVSRLKMDWAGDIAAYDKGHTHMLMFADTLTQGIVAQFPDKFKM